MSGRDIKQLNNRFIRKLGQVDRDIPYPHKPEHHAHPEVFVPQPTMSAPLPCILVSIRNGHKELFFRVADVDSFIKVFELSARERRRLIAGLDAANTEVFAM